MSEVTRAVIDKFLKEECGPLCGFELTPQRWTRLQLALFHNGRWIYSIDEKERVAISLDVQGGTPVERQTQRT